MNKYMSSSNSRYKRPPLTKDADFNWNMHATQEVDYRVSTVKGALHPKNLSLAKKCVNNADRNTKNKLKRLVIIDKKVDEIYGDNLKTYFSSYRGGYSTKFWRPG